MINQFEGFHVIIHHSQYATSSDGKSRQLHPKRHQKHKKKKKRARSWNCRCINMLLVQKGDNPQCFKARIRGQNSGNEVCKLQSKMDLKRCQYGQAPIVPCQFWLWAAPGGSGAYRWGALPVKFFVRGYLTSHATVFFL